jgi:hypothetical protein
MRKQRAGQVTDVLVMILFFALLMFLIAQWAVYYSDISGKTKTTIAMNNMKDGIGEVCTNKRFIVSQALSLPKNTALLVYSCEELAALTQIGPVGKVTLPAAEVGGLQTLLNDCITKGELKKNIQIMYVWKDEYKLFSLIPLRPAKLTVDAIPTYCVMYDFSGDAFLGGGKQVCEIRRTGTDVVSVRPVSLEG